MLGTAEFDVDWAVPVQAMREELRRLVEGTELWDGRVCVLQVTDATGGMVRVRALVSAADAGSLWDLRCLVREHLVAWVRDHRPTALPRMRTEVGDAGGGLPWQGVQPRRPVRRRPTPTPDDARSSAAATTATPERSLRRPREPRPARRPGPRPPSSAPGTRSRWRRAAPLARHCGGVVRRRGP